MENRWLENRCVLLSIELQRWPCHPGDVEKMLSHVQGSNKIVRRKWVPQTVGDLVQVYWEFESPEAKNEWLKSLDFNHNDGFAHVVNRKNIQDMLDAWCNGTKQ